MTKTEVRQRIEGIRKAHGDEESAHAQEDRLYQDVLASIANGTCEDVQEVARLCLLTKDIEFARWCA